MKHKIVTLSELTSGDNKRMCLSAKRALDKCHECPSYGGQKGSRPCESRVVNKKYDELVKQKKKLRKELEGKMANIDKQIEEL